MSAEATGWVFRHSPLTGAEFTIHLAVADSVNDQNDNELWMKQDNLAAKARTTRRTVNGALAHMVELGLLTPADEGADLRKAKHMGRCFRLLMPARFATETHQPPMSNVNSSNHPMSSDNSSRCEATTHRDEQPQLIVGTQAVTQAEPKPLPMRDGDLFAEFWDAFGLKRGAIPKAREAWAKACKKADPDHLIAIAAQYHEWCITEEVSQKYAQGWLNDERWNDELTSRRRRTKVERGRRNMTEGVARVRAGDTFEARMKRAGEIGRAREARQLALNEGTNR